MGYHGILTVFLLIFTGLFITASPLDHSTQSEAFTGMGTITIASKCPYKVWMHWSSVDPTWGGIMHEITSNPETHNMGAHPYGGVFMFCSKPNSAGNCTDPMSQVEYDIGSYSDNWIDVSNYDATKGNPPCMALGMSLTVSGGTGPNAARTSNCADIDCAPGQNPCQAAYLPGDKADQAGKSHACSPDVNLALVACSG